MKIYLASAIPDREHTYIPLVEQLAREDRFGVHSLTEDPEAADIILFLDGNHHGADPSLNAIRRHPLAVRHRDRTFLYDERDHPWCAMPGLYVSMTRRAFDSRRQRAFPYLTLTNHFVLDQLLRRSEPDLLFSFMGRRSHPVRETLFRIAHPRGFMEDTSHFNAFAAPSGADPARRRYAEILARGKFVLCPRGEGAASFRLFETMAIGRVPVIISDAWVPPAGPDWDAISLRLPERDALHAAALVEASEHRFPAMARAARAAWEQWCAPAVLFHRLVESCVQIRDGRRMPEALAQRLPDARHLWLLARALKARTRALLHSARSAPRASAALQIAAPTVK